MVLVLAPVSGQELALELRPALPITMSALGAALQALAEHWGSVVTQ